MSTNTNPVIAILDELRSKSVESETAVRLQNRKHELANEKRGLSDKIDNLKDELIELEAELDSVTGQLDEIDEEEVRLQQSVFGKLPKHVKAVPVTSADQVYVGTWFSCPASGAAKVATITIEDFPGGYYIVARGERGTSFRFRVYRGEFMNINHVKTYAMTGSEAC